MKFQTLQDSLMEVFDKPMGNLEVELPNPQGIQSEILGVTLRGTKPLNKIKERREIGGGDLTIKTPV